MSVVLAFDPSIAGIGAVRYTAETLATLLEWRWRIASADARATAQGEALVFVGAPERAPREAAAVIAVREWATWDPDALALGRFEGEPIACPRGAIEQPLDARELPEPWLRSLAFTLTREEERLDRTRDQWECFSGTSARLERLGVLDQPLVDRAAKALAHRIEAWCERQGVKLAPLPRWKNGRHFAAALTHDVDDVTLHSFPMALRLLRQTSGARSYAFRGGLTALARAVRHAFATGDPYWNFDRWASEESHHGFRSTFYLCPPAPAERHEYDALYAMEDEVRFEGRRMRVAEMFRTLTQRGFEIGLHGSYLSHRSGEELLRQKRQIESAVGGPVRGIRQHFLRFDVDRTWAAQDAAGFAYDTTLGFNEAIGFRAGIAAPFRPWDPAAGRPHQLLELPLTLMDGTLFRSLRLDGPRAGERVREHLERVEAAGGLAVLLWHPNAAAERQFPGWWHAYRAALEHLAARGAWVAPAAEIAEWWEARLLAANPAARAVPG